MSLFDASYRTSYEHALYRGNLMQAVEVNVEDAVQHMVGSMGMPRSRASAAVSARLVLRAATLLEGWAVDLSRWSLEAALAGSAQVGSPSEFLTHCKHTLEPPVLVLLDDVAKSGEVRRNNISRAIGQCASQQNLWARLANRTFVTNAPRNGVDEFTRLFWTPIHFAAAFPSVDVITELLELAPSDLLTQTNGVGFSPLHVAVSHGSLQTTAVLASASSLTAKARDRSGRTAAELAVATSFSAARCRALLSALGVRAAEAKRRCKAVTRRRSRRRKEAPHSPSLSPGPASFACYGKNGGGWERGSGDVHLDDEEDNDDEDGYEEDQTDGQRSSRRCDIPVVPSIDSPSLILDHLGAGIPVLVTNAMEHSDLCARWTRQGFTSRHGQVLLNPELYPYADASAHLYGTQAGAHVPAAHVIDGLGRQTTHSEADAAETDAASFTAGRPPRSVFRALSGWSRIPYRGDGTERRTAHGDIRLTDSLDEPQQAGTRSPDTLMTDFERPPFVEDEQWLLRTATVQFYLGGAFSGAQPHWHGHAWNWLVHGRKRWFLWPPEHAIYTQRHVLETLGEQKEQQQPRAMEQQGRTKGHRPPGPQTTPSAALVCEQQAGEVLVVPELWGHATVNLQTSIGWASEMVFDRFYDDGLGEKHGPEWWRLETRVAPNQEAPSSTSRGYRSSTWV